MTEKRFALVIGIDYRGFNCRLNGCEIDAGRFDTFLGSLGYQVTLMTQTSAVKNSALLPTKVNIIAKMNEIGNVGATHIALFYAGHGTQLSSKDKSETDGLDECLVCLPVSGQGPTINDLLDDGKILSIVSKWQAKTFMMFDACHSGTICDLGFMLDRSGSSKKIANGYVNPSQNIICISAADDSEVALETNGGGSATNKFFQCWTSGGRTVEHFCKAFSTMGLQTPQISSSKTIDTKLPLF